MIRWIQRTQARRILVPSLTFVVGMIVAHAILDYHFHGRIRYDFFPHRLMLYLLGQSLWGSLDGGESPLPTKIRQRSLPQSS